MNYTLSMEDHKVVNIQSGKLEAQGRLGAITLPDPRCLLYVVHTKKTYYNIEGKC